MWPAKHVSCFESEGVKKLAREVREQSYEVVEEDIAGVPREVIQLCKLD